MKGKKNISIVGAGPGGLSAAILLANSGHNVTVYEKNAGPGGRNGCIEMDGFRFDIGPTFLMFKDILEEIFEEAGEKVEDYLEFYELDPMYRLVFKDESLDLSPDHEKTRKEISKKFPGEESGFDRLLEKEKKRFETAYPCLQKDYSSFFKLFNKDLINFIPKLDFPSSMHDQLAKYFSSEDLRMAFTFQSKYLGMSPWNCPAAFMMIPYIEHNFGIQHVRGGLSEISEAMVKVLAKKGGNILFNTEVEHAEAKRIRLISGEIIESDEVIVNADVGYAMKHLMKTADYSKRKYSCSIYMLYLGIDADPNELGLEHHTVYFSDDYKRFVDSIFNDKTLTDDISFYVRNASRLDPDIAPKGKSNIYVLVPVPNNKSGINWDEHNDEYRSLVVRKLKEKTGIDADKAICEKIITPYDWERDYNVLLGGVFNLAHSLDQMLYLRPHNKLADGLYLVGGGTHPGSGLPTIYESGRITARLIMNG